MNLDKSLTLRPAREDDAAALALLHRMGFAEGWSAPAMRTLLAGAAHFGFVVEDIEANALRAVVIVQVATDQSEILTIATAPSMRRKGLARALLVAAGKEAASRGAREMFLEVAEDNDAARGLYENLGFSLSGRRRGYYRDREGHVTDALLFRARIPFAL